MSGINSSEINMVFWIDGKCHILSVVTVKIYRRTNGTYLQCVFTKYSSFKTVDNFTLVKWQLNLLVWIPASWVGLRARMQALRSLVQNRTWRPREWVSMDTVRLGLERIFGSKTLHQYQLNSKAYCKLSDINVKHAVITLRLLPLISLWGLRRSYKSKPSWEWGEGKKRELELKEWNICWVNNRLKISAVGIVLFSGYKTALVRTVSNWSSIYYYKKL